MKTTKKEVTRNKYGKIPYLPRKEVELFLSKKYNKNNYPYIYFMLQETIKVEGNYMIK